VDASWNKERFYDFREPTSATREGDGSTRWYFSRPRDQADAPSAAVRFQISARSPYHVDAVAYCERESCGKLLKQLSEMPPPAPNSKAEVSVRSDWLQEIASEACGAGAANSDPPSYPIEERRREIGGRVELRLVANSCGVIRGALSVKSSGNRNLDRSARRKALTWRLPSPSAPGGSRYWATWLEFGGSSAGSARDESVATGEFTAVPSLDP
jgi:TonB family protein